MLAAVDQTFALANYIESGLWLSISLVFAFFTSRVTTARNDAIAAAIGFAFFGASDIVEAHTGAWWNPWWLLVWKGLCLLLFLILLIRYVKRPRSLP